MPAAKSRGKKTSRAADRPPRRVRPIAADPSETRGVLTARVTNIKDPEGRGRVKVSLLGTGALRGFGRQVWARVATLVAGNDRGSWFIPEVGDEVLVAFENGDAGRPVVLGALWSADASPPAVMDAQGRNNKKLIRLRSGIELAFSDKDGEEAIALSTPAGQKIAIDDLSGTITITDAQGNSVLLESAGIRIAANVKVTLQATTVEIAASALGAEVALAKFSGVVQCDTLIANSVVSSSYTPGAGNIW